MELKKILAGVEGLKAKGNLDLEIPNVTTDSREIKAGDMFVAIKGFEADGHKYIPAAIVPTRQRIPISRRRCPQAQA